MVEPDIVSMLVWYVEINKAYLVNDVCYLIFQPHCFPSRSVFLGD